MKHTFSYVTPTSPFPHNPGQASEMDGRQEADARRDEWLRQQGEQPAMDTPFHNYDVSTNSASPMELSASAFRPVLRNPTIESPLPEPMARWVAAGMDTFDAAPRDPPPSTNSASLPPLPKVGAASSSAQDDNSAMQIDEIDLDPPPSTASPSSEDIDIPSIEELLKSIPSTLHSGEAQERAPKRIRGIDKQSLPNRAGVDTVIGPYALKKAQLEKFFLVIGMADSDTRKRLQAHIAALPDAAAFVKFVTRVVALLPQFATVLEDGKTKFPLAADFQKIRTQTRSHPAMEANPLIDKLRGSTGKTQDGHVKGTAFQVRHEVLLFLEEFDIDAPSYAGRVELREVIHRFKTFFSRDFYEAVLAECNAEPLNSGTPAPGEAFENTHSPSNSESSAIPECAGPTMEPVSDPQPRERSKSGHPLKQINSARTSQHAPRKRKGTVSSASKDCNLIFVRDQRMGDSAPALPEDLVNPLQLAEWTVKDVLSRFGPSDPTYTAELYTVGIQCRPTTLQAGDRISGNLMGNGGALPPGHLELVLKPMAGSGEPGQLVDAADHIGDTESVSGGSNGSDSEGSSDEAVLITESAVQNDWKPAGNRDSELVTLASVSLEGVTSVSATTRTTDSSKRTRWAFALFLACLLFVGSILGMYCPQFVVNGNGMRHSAFGGLTSSSQNYVRGGISLNTPPSIHIKSTAQAQCQAVPYHWTNGSTQLLTITQAETPLNHAISARNNSRADEAGLLNNGAEDALTVTFEGIRMGETALVPAPRSFSAFHARAVRIVDSVTPVVTLSESDTGLAVGFPYSYNPTEDPEVIAVYASFALLLLLPQVIGGFSTVRKLCCTAAESTSPEFLAVTARLIGTLRDDGFALFAVIAYAVLLCIAQEIDHPTPTEIAWIMSSPAVIFVASIDVWIFRFDRAAWERHLPHIQFLRKKQGDGVAEPREWENPDLEDVSLRNGLRAANELSSRISSIYYFPLAIFVQVFGAFAFYLPLSDFRGRQSGIEEPGVDILRITASIYGALSCLVGTFRLLRKPTFKFTVRSQNGFRQVTARELPGGSRERKLLFDIWTLGVDWLASRIDLEIMSDEELAFFERQQIEELQGPVVREEGDHPRRLVGSLVRWFNHIFKVIT